MTAAWPPVETGDTPTSTENVIPINNPTKRVRISESYLPWASDVQKRLSSLVHLEQGWDGYNAPPVRFENASFVLKVLERICSGETPPPQIVPGNAGDLQIEWHEEGGDVELHVIEPYVVEGWRSGPMTCADGEELRFKTDFTVAARWLEELMEPAGAPAAEAN